MPYLILAVFLAVSRMSPFPLQEWLLSLNISWQNIFGSEISAGSTPLYLPGTMLVIVGLITIYLHRMQIKEVKSAALDSLKMLAGACVGLISTIPMARLYINSGLNDLGIESMPLPMAHCGAVSVRGV